MTDPAISVITVPYGRDNYGYLVHRPDGGSAIAIDAGAGPSLLRAARSAGVELVGVLSTHHHADHVGGNLELCRQLPALRVFGAAAGGTLIPGLTDPVRPGGRVELAGLSFVVIATPGHTGSSVSFAGHGWVFTGDTLFGAGCGRVFEGTAAELCASLRRLADGLPGSTRIGFGHEYTAQNLRFAARVEPGNAAVAVRAERVAARLAAGDTSVPSTLEEELATNPFLRLESAEIRAHLGCDATAPAAVVFAALRGLKDRG